MSRDRDATAAELARFDPADGEAYLRLLADWEGGLAGAHARWNAGPLDPASSTADAAYEALRVAQRPRGHRRAVQPPSRRATC